MNEELKKKLELAHKIAYMEGLAKDETRGHITVKDQDNRIYIKPWGVGFEEVTANDLLCVDLDGNLLDGQGRLHSELPIHLEIYRRRKDVSSVFHVHPQYSVILSSIFRERIKIISQHGIEFAGKIPIYESPELINFKKQGEELAKKLGDRPLLLMRNHGIVTVGRTIEEALIRAIHFEKLAIENLIISLFGKAVEISPKIAEKMGKKVYSQEQQNMFWEYYCRKLEREFK